MITNTAQLASAQNAAAGAAPSASPSSAENAIEEGTPEEQLNAAEELDGDNETGNTAKRTYIDGVKVKLTFPSRYGNRPRR